MFSTEKNFKKGLFLLSLMLMVFITSCADLLTVQPTIKMDVPPPQTTQLKTFKTSGEYLKAGKASFDARQFDEARAYLSDAVRLDQKNQAAHLLLGVTYVKLGRGSEARREFNKAVQIDAKTGDAETAKSWLKRLDNPLMVAILPVKESFTIEFTSVFAQKDQIDWKAKKIDQFILHYLPDVEKLYYRTLTKVLSDCGFYSIINLYGEEPSKWKYDAEVKRSLLGITPIVKMTNTAKERGKHDLLNAKNVNAKIIIDCDIDFNVKEGIMLIGEHYTFLINTSLRLYSVKDMRLIKNIYDKITLEKVPTPDLSNYLNKAFNKLFQKMALEIHNALL